MGNHGNRLSIGDIVVHFKTHQLYKILAVAQHTETEEPLVIYQAMYAPFIIYARPRNMFLSKVDREKYPEAIETFRLTKVWFYEGIPYYNANEFRTMYIKDGVVHEYGNDR